MGIWLVSKLSLFKEEAYEVLLHVSLFKNEGFEVLLYQIVVACKFFIFIFKMVI